ncbi:TetR/AcrR family transcriptional regulator [Arthrobacter russicus]|uniref:AcrR family transcriptional regulator n=1 Tax=Arthrobacter russicus TaxID=172040 RepID=A0ABU1JEM0_9MICC|nr:TetR/AcrR family transcriptional regulator [Arthrobacter russicus]MDR6270808.1 AcrR family transcriptional regulator [Arthrobacter russicus]
MVEQKTAQPTARGVRARAREQVLAEILTLADAQLQAKGASELSLRAIARELGMVSSAIYRYFPSAEALLTALIIRSYNELAEAAQQHFDAAAGGDRLARFLAVCHGSRDWALANPHRYALIYGSPVPGYQAPQETVEPAGRVGWLMLTSVAGAEGVGLRLPPDGWPQERDLLAARLGEFFGGVLDADQISVGVAAWSHLFGLISFELFGHFVGSVTDNRVYFEAVMRNWAAQLGLE